MIIIFIIIITTQNGIYSNIIIIKNIKIIYKENTHSYKYNYYR